MKILISAAETSSDQHGAKLLESLKRLSGEMPDSIDAFGVGGPKLKAAGLRIVVDARELLAMGFTEVLSRLPRIRRALGELAAAAAREKPDVAVVIDYPDFHFRLASKIKRFGFPIVYYIPPKVWAWRRGRIRVLRDRFDRILTILPFEVGFYKKEGVPATYVGNPLLDELPLHLSRSEARHMLGIPDAAAVLVLMPGSRPAEFHHHLHLMLDAALGAAIEMKKKLTVRVPLPLTAPFEALQRKIMAWRESHAHADEWTEVRASQGDAHLSLLSADAGLIKSGTSTLEAALLGCVHAVVYQADWVSHFVFQQIVRRSFKGPVGLVNLVHGWKPGEPWLVNEFIERGTGARELQREVVSLFSDEKKRARIQAGLAKIKSEMTTESSPSDRAAREILSLLSQMHRGYRGIRGKDVHD